jgi:Mg2+-importing ATPase
LSSDAAAARLREYGRNVLREHRAASHARTLLNQLRSPLLLLLVFAAIASFVSRAWLDATMVLTIVAATVAIGYWREYSAQTAIDALRSRIHTRSDVLRDGQPASIDIETVVPGDVVRLSAGNLVPADGILIEATDFFVNQAVLTGESFPVEKRVGIVSEAATLAERSNCVLMGTNVRSGTARCLVVHTGASTEFGGIAGRLALRPPETTFDRGIRRFGYLLSVTMLLMVLVVFAGHMFRGRSPVETLLFSVALAVGLSPELLPAILTVNLARGARIMAQRGVLVRRLNAIENLGSMNVLCTDKTGTLTEGVVRVEGAYDPDGQSSPDVLELAACNAALQTGLRSPLDDAILSARTPDLSRVRKIAEIPFDFVRKRVSVVVGGSTGPRLITKGAFHDVLGVCTRIGHDVPIDAAIKTGLERQHDKWSGEGIRVLAVATRDIPAIENTGPHEREMTFAGFLACCSRRSRSSPCSMSRRQS